MSVRHKSQECTLTAEVFNLLAILTTIREPGHAVLSDLMETLSHDVSRDARRAHLETLPDSLNVIVSAPFLSSQQPLLHDSLWAIEAQHELRLDARLHVMERKMSFSTLCRCSGNFYFLPKASCFPVFEVRDSAVVAAWRLSRIQESRAGTWTSKAALFSSFLGKPSMSTCCLPPFSMASSSKLMVTCGTRLRSLLTTSPPQHADTVSVLPSACAAHMIARM